MLEKAKRSGRIQGLLLYPDKKDCVYFVFVHPKTGSSGYENISDESKSRFMKDLLVCIRENRIFEMNVNNSTEKIEFKKNF